MCGALLLWLQRAELACHEWLLIEDATSAWRGRALTAAWRAWTVEAKTLQRFALCTHNLSVRVAYAALRGAMAAWADCVGERLWWERVVRSRRTASWSKLCLGWIKHWRRKTGEIVRWRRRRDTATYQVRLSLGFGGWVGNLAHAAAAREQISEATERWRVHKLEGAVGRWRSLLAVRPDKGWGRRGRGSHLLVDRSERTTSQVEVLVFGAGGFGQLGTGREEDILTPAVLLGLGQLRIQARFVANRFTPFSRRALHRPSGHIPIR